MKRFLVALCCGLLMFASSCDKDDDDYTPGGGGGGGGSTYKVTFWSDFQGSPISVYVNGNYKGEITRIYSSSPGCDASGCVTVYFSTTGSFSYTASDGTRNWNNTSSVSSSCKTINLTR